MCMHTIPYDKQDLKLGFMAQTGWVMLQTHYAARGKLSTQQIMSFC